MSDSNLNQNTSEDTSFPAAAPETNASAPAPQSAGPEEEPKQKTFTRRTVLAMAGCGVAGLVVGGVLASWGVTSASIASGAHRDTHHAHEDDRDRPCPLLGLPAMRDRCAR